MSERKINSSPGGHSALVKDMPGLASRGPFRDVPSPDTNKPFVRDMTYEELEELIETCVRRVLQGDDIKREYAKLKATEKR